MRKLPALIIALLLSPALAFAISQVDFVGGFPVKKPVDAAVDEQGRIFVVDALGGVFVKTLEGELISSWGAVDPLGAWKLKKPGGIAVEGDRVYVTDSSTGGLLVFSTDGRFIDSFPTNGSSSALYNFPLGIAVFGGVIYVADPLNGKVQTFGPDGMFLGSIGDGGDEMARLKRPVDVAVDYGGRLYVVDAKSKAVQVYQASGKHIRNFPLEDPIAVATDIDGFYVADDKYKIKKFGTGGEFAFTFGTPGDGRAQFQEISGLAVGKGGMVIASDIKKDSVQFYAPERKKYITPEKNPPPTSVKRLYDVIIDGIEDIVWGNDDRLYGIRRKDKLIVVLKVDHVVKTLNLEDVDPVALTKDDDGYLWVLDGKHDTLIKLDTSGNFRLKVGSSGKKEGQFSGAADIAVSRKGFIYVADKDNGRVQIFNGEGIFLASLGQTGTRTFLERPAAVALDTKDNAYVLDEKRYSVVKFSADGKHIGEFGRRGEGPADFDEPCAILVSNGEVFVLDRGKSTIKVFDLNGNFRRLFGAESREAGFKAPSSITMKDNTVMFVSDTGNGRIRALSFIYTLEPPSALLASGGMRKIDLAWPELDDETKSIITRYNVYRSDNPVTDFKKIASVTSGSYSDQSVVPDRPYYYRVSVAARDGNESVKTRTVEARAMKHAVSPPKGLVAEPLDVEVTLRWEPNVESFLKHYAVYRKELGAFKLIGTVNTPSFNDKNLRRRKIYTYRVSAVSTDNVESEPAEVKTRTLAKKPAGSGIANSVNNSVAK